MSTAILARIQAYLSRLIYKISWRTLRDRTLVAGILVLFSLPAIVPMISQPGKPWSDDFGIHLYRLIELDRLWQHGILWSRWAPDFAGGYGYPIFHFYPPLAYFIAEIPHLLGASFPLAIKLSLAGSILVLGWSTCALVADRFDTPAGIVAGVLAIYAPYTLYDTYYRANLAESWALPALSLALWGLGRIPRLGWRAVPIASLSLAALLLTHNIYAMLGVPLTIAYALTLCSAQPKFRSSLLPLLTATILGLALSAFFWIPAFFERTFVQIERVLVDPFRYFLPFNELFALPPRVDLSLINRFPPRCLGWGSLLPALLGLGLPRRGRESQLSTLFFVTIAILATLLTTSFSAPLWSGLPLLRYVQFPWRFLGIAVIALAALTGSALHAAQQRWHNHTIWVTVLLPILAILAATPWLYNPFHPIEEHQTIADFLRWEQDTHVIGTTAQGEYLPRTVASLPDTPADPRLLTEDPPPLPRRLDRETLPPEVYVVGETYGPLDATLIFSSPRPFQVLYRQFAYPGWSVEIDGEPVPIAALHPHGLLTFEVPTGNHQVDIRFRSTPLQRLAHFLSTLALLAIPAILLYAHRRTQSPSEHPPLLSTSQIAALVAAACTAAILKWGLLDHVEDLLLTRRFDSGQITGLSHPTSFTFGDLIRLHGYELTPQPVSAGDSLRVDLYFSVTRPADQRYGAYVRLVDEDGRLWSLKDNGRPDGYREPPHTPLWPTDGYADDAYTVQILPGTPPSLYTLEIGVFEWETRLPLPVTDDQGNLLGSALRLGTVEVIRPALPPAPEELNLPSTCTGTVGPLQLLGCQADRDQIEPGGPLLLTLAWRATTSIPEPLTTSFTLGQADQTWSLGSFPSPAGVNYPTTHWLPGEVVRGQYLFTIPPDLPPGEAVLSLQIANANGTPSGPPIELLHLPVEAPQRLWTLPELETPIQASLGGTIILLGANFEGQLPPTPGSTLSLTLYWQAQQPIARSYKVFVQLLDTDGQIVAQDDNIPAGWTRPTTGWLPGEIIPDRHTLTLPEDAPPGPYTLIAGLYDEQTMQRLVTLNAENSPLGDAISIPLP